MDGAEPLIAEQDQDPEVTEYEDEDEDGEEEEREGKDYDTGVSEEGTPSDAAPAQDSPHVKDAQEKEDKTDNKGYIKNLLQK